MFNLDELVIYLIIIIGVIFIIHMYNQMYPKSPHPIWEGITNTTTKNSTTDKKDNITGYTVGAVGFNEDIIGLISTLDTKLKINKYSDDYIEILTNLKELYTKATLEELLSSSVNPAWSIQRANTYKAGIDMIEKITPLISSSSGSSMTSFGGGSKAKKSKSKSKNTSADDEENEDDDEDANPKPSSWMPSW
jgi:hypothetical protein